MRTTIRKVNALINKHGFEIVKGKGYYYFSSITDNAPRIGMDGLYGTPYLTAWTPEQIEKELLFRIENPDYY